MISGVKSPSLLIFWHKCDIMKVMGVYNVSAFFCATSKAFFEISVA